MGNVTEILSRKAMLSFDYHEIEKYPNMWKIITRSRDTIDALRYMLFQYCAFTKIILDGRLILNTKVVLPNNGDILYLSGAYIKRDGANGCRYDLYISGKESHTVYVSVESVAESNVRTMPEHSRISTFRSPLVFPVDISLEGPNSISNSSGYYKTNLDILSRNPPERKSFSTFAAYNMIRVPLGSLSKYTDPTQGYPSEAFGISEFNFSLDFTEDYIEDFSEDYLTYVEALQNEEESEQEEN